MPTFGEDATVALAIGPGCELVVVGKLGVTKNLGYDTKMFFDGVLVEFDLGFELVELIKKSE